MTVQEDRYLSRLSRRDFVVAGGASLGISAAASLSAPALSASAVSNWDRQTDVIVVGSGGAASAAALTARLAGAGVLMLEKSPVIGGTTAKSGGAFYIPNNFRLREKGIEDARIPFLSHVASHSYPHLFDPASPTLGLSEATFSLLDAFYENGTVMADLFRSSGALRIGHFSMTPEGDQIGWPEYGRLDGYNKVPRGRSLGVVKADGSLGTGSEMIRQFNAKFDDLQLPRLTGHQVTRLVLDEAGAVVGVEALTGERPVRFRARRGVIFGSGGFAYNREMLNRHHITPVYGGCGVPTNTGDLVTIASAVGAKFGNMASAWRAQIVLEEALQYVSVPSDIWVPPGDSMLLVNKYGKRALNEKRNYQDRTRAQIAFDANRSEFPNQLMFMLYDSRTAELFAGVHPLPDLPTGASSVIVGNNWDDLSDRLDERLAALSSQTGNIRLAPTFKAELAKTVSRFNRFAENGKDEDFERGDREYDLMTASIYGAARSGTRWGTTAGKNPTMYPLQEKGPFYAVILAPGVLDTNGGPVINANGQILRENNTPIDGLYGAGNCIASLCRDSYWGMGSTLGPAMTFGYLAGKHASSTAPRT